MRLIEKIRMGKMKSRQVSIADFWVKNYRSCKNTKLNEIPKLCALIGKNASGKTNILNALTLLRTTARTRRRPQEKQEFSTRCQLGALFMIGDTEVPYRASFSISAGDSRRERISNLKEEWNFDGLGLRSGWIEVPLDSRFVRRDAINRPSGEEGFRIQFPVVKQKSLTIKTINLPGFVVDAFDAINEYRLNIKYYSASQFSNPEDCPSYFEIDEDGDLEENYGQKHLGFLYDMYILSTKDKKSYRQFLSVVGRDGLQLVDEISWNEFQIVSNKVQVQAGGKVSEKKLFKTMIVPTVIAGPKVLSFSQLSEGAFRAMALLFYLVSDKSRLLLMEEPEIGIHHGLLTKIVNLIKVVNQQKQIVFSTHSDNILDVLDPENIFIVRKNESGDTSCKNLPKTMSAQNYKALKEYLSESGNLGDYWKAGGIE